jgi:putative Holliday junction resolvase
LKIISVDLGTARTGLAICDEGERLASPLTVLSVPGNRLVSEIARLVAQNEASLLVVGLPLNMDGSKGESAHNAGEFAKKLQAHVGVPVKLWDERLTTVSAHRALNVTDTRGKNRRAVVDSVAAVIILEDYLRYRKNS